ncbi:hypothetical protein BXZ70DRAFT_1005632 [Cristinia sonorae]|uniref:Uncharacterized protein n=1 Tax=Cristinia sonorae TaxID=1940300 RepID=A0A8K0UUX1_9AGAR|nr:hypothetical protein BXZ70DRAFT_1005632 [Cristinia sonorae]
MQDPAHESPVLSSLAPAAPTSPRPITRPSGPRTRRPGFKAPLPLNLSNGNSPSDESVPAYSGRNSPVFHGGSRPHSPMASLSQLSETALNSTCKVPLRREQGVQTCITENHPQANTTTNYAAASSTSGEPSRSSTPAVKLIVKPPTLETPPALNFESVPVAWKGLTLQAAQWTFSSEQLQDIVSRAIRMSAQEEFIRLLSVKMLDEELRQETERLETLKATTQSQYRFNMHRRTMLLQSLLAVAGSGDADPTAMINLTTQLAEITVSCDRLMETMVSIADQRAQIQHLQDVHISSALAMALRKLNGSYAKRTVELKESRAHIEQLKAELEEAWNVAEDMAQEMDDLDNFHSGFSSGAEEDTTMLKGDDETMNDLSVRLAKVSRITGTAVVSKAILTNLGDAPGSGTENAEPAEPESAPLPPSTPASPALDRDTDRMSRVFAARKRSTRRSKASLRIPKSTTSPPTADRASVMSRRSRSKSLRSIKNGESFPPPVPVVVDSFLEMSETRPGSPVQETTPPVPQLPADISSAASGSAPPAPTSPRPTSPHFDIPGITIDYVEEQPSSNNAAPTRRVQSMMPPQVHQRSMDDSEVKSTSARRVSKAEYGKFDGWPWGGGDGKKKRHSMPLTRLSLDEAKKSVAEKAFGAALRRESSLGPAASAKSTEDVRSVGTS